MADASDIRRELIAFRIGEQRFGVDIRTVREIRGWSPATPLPQAPAYVKGVINLRGTVLPIVDLGARLGLGSTVPTARHVIIVARVGMKTVGLMVEAVSDILTVAEADIQPTPDVSCDTVRMFVRGLIALEGDMISMLALDSLLPDANLADAA
jgi:purine-binding chemotaxis protein CheW